MKEEKVIVTEHVLEIRHAASGSFLDVRGYIADYVVGSGLFPHWEIESNIINFKDAARGIEKIGGFAGYKSAGIFAFDPDTRNYFEDKASQYWRTLIKNQFYAVPEPTRFGCRTKAFLNSTLNFEAINKKLYIAFFTDKFIALLGKEEKDFQTTIELSVADFTVRLTCGPIHKEEAKRYFNFQSEHFTDTGIFLDIDVYKEESISKGDVTPLIKKAMVETWKLIDKFSEFAGV